MLAPGSRLNASTDEPGTLVGTVGVGTFQLNVDGLRVTQNQTSGFGQPKYSKDAIAEFEFVSSRFDATQGGSMGVQVNAITKSGTNMPSGSFSGYFRDDALVGKDFVQDRVLPYSNQQWSWTFGGPIRKDRAHFFVNYEFERQPTTITYSSAYPSFNIDQLDTITETKGGMRLDFQFSPRTRLSVRGNGSERWEPYDTRYTGGASNILRRRSRARGNSTDVGVTLTQVLGSSTFNEIVRRLRRLLLDSRLEDAMGEPSRTRASRPGRRSCRCAATPSGRGTLTRTSSRTSRTTRSRTT